MHERSLVRRLLSQVDEVATSHGGDRVARIEVEIGPLAGVEPQLIREAFDQIKLETGHADTQLDIREVPMVVHCRRCDKESELKQFVFRCATCGLGDVRIIRGDEFRLLNLTLDHEHHAC